MHEGNLICMKPVPLRRPRDIAVQIVLPEGAAYARQVYPDLMGPPCIKAAADQGNGACFHKPVLCFAGFAIGMDLSFNDAAGFPGDRGIDDSVRGRQSPVDQGKIFFLHALFDQLSLDFRQFGKNHKAGCVSVQPGDRMQIQLPALLLIIQGDMG